MPESTTIFIAPPPDPIGTLPELPKHKPSTPQSATSCSSFHFFLIIFGILTFSSLLFLTFFVSNEPEICQTAACKAAGISMYDSINFSISPCNNFYEFACGGWIANNPIPPDQGYLTKFRIAETALEESLRELLEQNQTKPMPRSVQLAIDLYRECLDQKSRDSLGLGPLKELLAWILPNTSWPILKPEAPLKDQPNGTSHFLEILARFRTAGDSAILNFGLDTDVNASESKLFYFVTPTFSLERIMFADPVGYETNLVAYRKLMLDIAGLFSEENVDQKILEERIDEMIDLERRLALAEPPPEETQSSKTWYRKMTLSDFRSLTGNHFNWTELIRLHLTHFNVSEEISDSDQIIVMDTIYYPEMTEIILNTSTHILYNYMSFRLISDLRYAANSALEAVDFEHTKAITSITVASPPWKQCLATIRESFDFALSRLYVDYRVTSGTRERAQEMVADLREAFRGIVQHEAVWLDEETRARALEKADAITWFIAYPDWLLVDEELDGYYGFNGSVGVSVVKGHYMKSLLEYKRFVEVKDLLERHQPGNATLNWLKGPANVNAFADRASNSIILPAGILTTPFFDPDRPKYLNYAAIGSTIGHEITHHFDSKGREFDQHGRLVDWWSNSTTIHFDTASACFIEQYGSIVDEETGEQLNGVTCGSENIADNGAVREAYAAAFDGKSRDQHKLLPKMENFTAEQLFFLANAQIWCSNYERENLAYHIENSDHSPAMYRVNIPLSNFDAFAKVFACPAGAPMHPRMRCLLW